MSTLDKGIDGHPWESGVDVKKLEMDLFGDAIDPKSPQGVIYEYGIAIEDYAKIQAEFPASDINFLAFRLIDSAEKKEEVGRWFQELANWYELYKAEKQDINPAIPKKMIEFKQTKLPELKEIIERISTIATS